MAASEGDEVVAVIALKGEGPERDTVGGIQSGLEGEAIESVEEAEERRVAAVAEAEAAPESGVGDEAAPAPADGRCAREGGGLRGEAEQDLGEQVVVLQRGCRRRVGAAAAAEAAHLALLAH